MDGRVIIDAMTHAIGVYGHDLTLQAFNQPFVELFGFDASRLSGASVYDLASRDLNEAFFEALEASVADGQRRTVRNNSQDFKRVFDNIITPLADYIVIETDDVTAAVADEYALRLLNSSREHSFAQHLERVAICDFVGGRVTVSDAFCRLLGDMLWLEVLIEDGAKEPHLLTGEGLAHAGAPEFFTELLGDFARIWGTGQPQRSVRTAEIGGETRTLSVAISRWDFDDLPRGLVLLVSDLTELIESQRRAERARQIQHFAQGVAHDFGNIAQVLGGYAQLLSANPSAEVAAATASSLTRAADRAILLAQRIATIARLGHVANSRIDLAGVLQGNLDHIRAVTGDAITLRLDTPGSAIINANAEQMLSVVENLCHNAQQAMDGSGTITIGVEAGRPEGAVVLRVCDDGPGLPQQVLDHLFEPFVASSHGGSGLGLYLIHQYVTSIGGDVTVQTGAGGTTFRMTFAAA